MKDKNNNGKIGGLARMVKLGFDEMTGKFDKINGRFDQLEERLIKLGQEMDARFDEINLRLKDMERRLDRIENILLENHRQRIERLEAAAFGRKR